MPRIARTKLNSNYLHIMVQGLNKEYIFNEEKEIQTYLYMLASDSKNFMLKIVAYCVMNNHVHLLIYSPKIEEISKLMSKVNTKYAKYYNKKHDRCGYVFRNRYRAEEIYSLARFINCINYIHNNPVKAGMCSNKGEYRYSSYNDYLNKTGFVNDELIQTCFINNEIDYMQVIKENKDDEENNFIEYIDTKTIEKFLKEKNITLVDIKENMRLLKDFVNNLYFEGHMGQKEIADILGVNRLKIHRILK